MISSRTNGRMILLNKSFEAHECTVERPSHLICPGNPHSTTHFLILLVSNVSVHTILFFQ